MSRFVEEGDFLFQFKKGSTFLVTIKMAVCLIPEGWAGQDANGSRTLWSFYSSNWGRRGWPILRGQCWWRHRYLLNDVRCVKKSILVDIFSIQSMICQPYMVKGRITVKKWLLSLCKKDLFVASQILWSLNAINISVYEKEKLT